MNFRPISQSLTLLTGLLLVSCNDAPRAITEKRTLADDERQQPVGLADGERFGTDAMIAQLERSKNPPASPSGGTPEFKMNFQLPEGWKELDPIGMRDIDLRFGEDDAGEVSLVRASGSLEANVNRWRSQMGLEPDTPENIQALEERLLFGMLPSKLVKLDGDYTGFGKDQAAENYRMVGLVFSSAQGSIFVKMTGPRAEVEANEEKFFEFVQTIRPEQVGGSGQAPPPPPPTSNRESFLSFTLPEGWKELEPTAFRDINLRFGDNDEAEVSLVRASGTLEANVNRWRSQMGLEAETAQNIQALEDRTLLGQLPSKLIELNGDYTGFGQSEPQKDYRMVGLVYSAPQGSIFVKMTGPREVVEANEEKFHQFVQTIRPKEGN